MELIEIDEARCLNFPQCDSRNELNLNEPAIIIPDI